MTTAPDGLRQASSRQWVVAAVLVFVFAVLPVMCLVGVTGYLRLGSETSALRQSLMGSVNAHWDKKIAVNVGWFTTALVRVGSRALQLPPEPRAALESVRGVEVGVYQLRDENVPVARGAVLARADKAMAWRGWQRVVGVIQDRQLVAIYAPRRGLSGRHAKCCLLVFNGRDLVVASARGNLEPLLELAQKHLAAELERHPLALR